MHLFVVINKGKGHFLYFSLESRPSYTEMVPLQWGGNFHLSDTVDIAYV